MAGEKILVIDSSKRDVLPLIEVFLRPEGYVVIHALDGEKGVELALKENPDLIIADLAMGGRDQVILTRVRQAGRDTPFIFTGSSNSAEVFKWVLRVGAADYLLKPIDLDEARSAVERTLTPSLQVKQINRALTKRVQELSALHGLGRAVTATEELEECLIRIVEAAVYMTKAEEGFLLLLDEEKKELTLRAGKGLGEKFAKGFQIKSADSVVWQVVETGQPTILAGSAEDDGLKIKTGFLVQILLHVPLKLRGEVIGVLSVDNRIKRQVFDENDKHLLSALADYAAIAIDNAQRHERARAETSRLTKLLETREQLDRTDRPAGESAEETKQVRELSLLHDIGRAVTSEKDLVELFKRIVETAVYLTRAEEGFLLLLDKESDELFLRAGKGLGRTLAAGFRIKSRDSLAWQVIRSGMPAMFDGPDGDERSKIKTDYLVKSMLHVPLKAAGEAIGVLSVSNKSVQRSFSGNDCDLLAILADYAAIAIDNVQQHQRAESEIARLGELLAGQPDPLLKQEVAPVEVQLSGETVPLDWLIGELKAQKEAAQAGRQGAEQLAQEMADQLLAVKRLANGWQRQQDDVDGLTRRLAVSGVATAAEEGDGLAVTLADLRGTLDDLGAGLLIGDDQGIVAVANEAAARIMHSDRLTGQHLRQISPSSHWVSSVDRLQGDRPHGATLWEEVTFWHRGRLIKALFLPRSRDGKQRQTVILRDLFRERAAQLTLEDLTATVSQELRTPLTILSTYTDLLLAETVGLLVPTQQRLLQRMRRNLALMSGALDSPTVLSTGVGKDDESFLAVDLGPVLRDALGYAGPWLEEKGIQIERQMAEDLPPVVAQADCVYQMVLNLLQNAIQATPAGGLVELVVKVDSSVKQNGDRSHVIVSVRDEGGGIPGEFLSQVFERVYHKDDQPVPGLGGAGAELPTVKKLVDTFGGRVWAETEPGVGSTFSFLLPAVTV